MLLYLDSDLTFKPRRLLIRGMLHVGTCEAGWSESEGKHRSSDRCIFWFWTQREVHGLQSHLASGHQSFHFSASGSSESSTPSEHLNLQSFLVVRTSGSSELQVTESISELVWLQIFWSVSTVQSEHRCCESVAWVTLYAQCFWFVWDWIEVRACK